MWTECGIYGMKGNLNIIPDIVNGLKKLQHRGQESWGIATSDWIHKEKGLVSECNRESNVGIGHVRYSTSRGNGNLSEIQPLSNKIVSIVHNGTINFKQKDINDSQYLLGLFDNCDNIEKKLIEIVNTVPGVYCLLVLYKNIIYAVRDRSGIRPLSFSRGNPMAIASESCALKDDFEEILPGQIYRFGESIDIIYGNSLFCSFEYIYFMKPESIVNGKNVGDIRKKYGKMLAEQEKHNFSNDYIVVGSPNSGIISAKGYAEKMKLNYCNYITKNKDVGRTFIMPDNKSRQDLCNKKFIINNNINYKKVILVDDSLVRGNTIKKLIILIKQYNVKEIHIRIASPPIISSCYYGVDIPTYSELIAYNKSIDEIKTELDIDSLNYLSIDSLNKNCCTSCFDDNHHSFLLDW